MMIHCDIFCHRDCKSYQLESKAAATVFTRRRRDIKQIDRQAYLTPLLAIETNQKTISEQVSNVAIHSVSASVRSRPPTRQQK